MIFFSTPQLFLPDYPLETSEERDLNQNDPQQITDEDYENVGEMPAEGE